ncbi:hypothetical protein GCM10010178_79240 [Lentzea flava]|uniref:Secreted protein n=1 Tax=Lentzea flava TaxID=103732 RepID=A0ABQ2V9Z9_9PSEU|nr:hypothetical protein GCM10010178_79240 [Lentzea flava]
MILITCSFVTAGPGVHAVHLRPVFPQPPQHPGLHAQSEAMAVFGGDHRGVPLNTPGGQRRVEVQQGQRGDSGTVFDRTHLSTDGHSP